MPGHCGPLAVQLQDTRSFYPSIFLSFFIVAQRANGVVVPSQFLGKINIELSNPKKHVHVIHLFYRELLRLFINPELIKWSGLCEVYEKELKQGTTALPPTSVFTPTTEDGQKRWKDLRSRVVEHVSISRINQLVK